MTNKNCIGPMYTYTGLLSGITPGICTGTAGYLASAEIDQILVIDNNAHAHFDGPTSTDYLTYDGVLSFSCPRIRVN